MKFYAVTKGTDLYKKRNGGEYDLLYEISLDEKKKEQEENADYYFNEAEKIIKENDSHIPHLD